MKRKGELSAGRRDREWPHQIVKKANDCRTSNYDAIQRFCADLSLCPKGVSFVQDDEGASRAERRTRETREIPRHADSASRFESP
jgi:hypothetical protein